MASKLKLWNKIGRALSAVVLACFFLPFFGISCGGVDIITISGADMVGGCAPGGAIADKAGPSGDKMMESSDALGGPKLGGFTKVAIAPLAIVALAAAVIGFGLAWVRNRQALLAS